MPRLRHRCLVAPIAGLIALAGLAGAGSAWATYPGKPGRIAAGIYAETLQCNFPRPGACTFLGHIDSAAPDGSDLKRFGFDGLMRPAYSPNGRAMAATTGRTQAPAEDLYTPPRTGTLRSGAADGALIGRVRARSGDAYPVQTATDVSYTPKGRLLFVQDGRIVIHRGTFQPLQVVFNTGDPTARHARMSPDGSTIAYVRGSDTAPELWLVDSDGSDNRRFAAGVNGDKPDWSPDNTRLAFVTDLCNTRIADVATGAVTVPPTTECEATNVAWSPAGDELAVSTFYSVEVVPLDGSPARTVIPVGYIDDGGLPTVVALSWQPVR